MRERPVYVSENNYEHLSAKEFLAEWQDSLAKVVPRMAMDTETYHNKELRAPQAISKWIAGARNNCPFGASFFFVDTSTGERRGIWVTDDLPTIQPIFSDEDLIKVFHNSPYDVLMLGNIGVTVANSIRDTMAMIKLINEEQMCRTPNLNDDGSIKYVQSAKLKDLGYHFLGKHAHELENLVHQCQLYLAEQRNCAPSEVSYKDISDEFPKIMMDYAVYDTELTYDLSLIFEKTITQEDSWNAHDMGIQAMLAVVDTEREGVLVDQKLMAHDEALLLPIVSAAEKSMVELAGLESPGSDDSVLEAFAKLGVEWQWFTQKGSASTNKKTLTELATAQGGKVAELVSSLLTYRKASKILSTYIYGARNFIQEDGKVHSSFYLWANDASKGGAVTGRMSSADINLQNLTKKMVAFMASDEDDDDDAFEGVDIRVRDYYIPDPGTIFVSFDADQQEFRMLGHYSKDPTFMQIIHAGKDIHTGTAAAMFDIPYDEVTEEQRSVGKTGNFAKVYQQGTLAYANSLRRARKLPLLDEELCKQGTKFLYKRAPAYTYPPYKEWANYNDIIALAPDDDIKKGISYFLSDEVQTWMKIARESDKKYYEQFPMIKEFTKKVAQVARDRGYVKYWNGRRRHLSSPEFAYKMCNSIIQGGAAEVMKQKAYQVNDFLKANGMKSRVVMYVHDEIVLRMPVERWELDKLPEIKAILEDLPFRVPMTWGGDYSVKSWGQKTKLTTVDALWDDLKERGMV